MCVCCCSIFIMIYQLSSYTDNVDEHDESMSTDFGPDPLFFVPFLLDKGK